MEQNYNNEYTKSDNIAKTLAVIGIILAIMAIGWAMRADRNANTAVNMVTESSQQSSSEQTGAIDGASPSAGSSGSTTATTDVRQ